MPIYGYTLIDKSYKLVKNLTDADKQIYTNILEHCKDKIERKDVQKSIIIKFRYDDNDKPYILAYFDRTGTITDSFTYIQTIKDYINECNKALHDNDIYAYNDYTFIIRKLELKKERLTNEKIKNRKTFDFIKKRNKDRYFDITGSFEDGAIIMMEKTKR